MGDVKYYWKCTKSILDFTNFCYLFLSQWNVLSFWSMWMTFNHLKTNSTKFVHYRLKIRNIIEFFLTFSRWCNMPFSMSYIVFSKERSVYKVSFDYCKQLMSYSWFNNLTINKQIWWRHKFDLFCQSFANISRTVNQFLMPFTLLWTWVSL